ncbi:MAG: ABC transporter substrate-binding protein [Chloroflexota bacterium]|nr:ABC transporter substrate-binding protein [Chloroflexota bacterium]
MNRSGISILTALALTIAACGGGDAGGGTTTSKEPIKIGGIFDLTGATSDVGVPYSEGMKAYMAFTNENGGINGRQITLVSDDFSYQIPRAEEVYNRLATQENVVAVLGWGTGDTIALTPKITKDKLPFLSASYSEDLVSDVTKTPYNFMIGVTYSDQARVLLKYIKDNWKGSAPPKVSMSFSDSAFGKSPVADAKAFMQQNSITNTPDIVVALNSLDMSPQLLAVKGSSPDFIIMNHTAAPTAVEVKSAKAAGLDKTGLATISWGFSEKTIELAGSAAEGALATIVATPFSVDVPGHKEILDYLTKTGKDPAKTAVNYVQGWVTAKVLLEGIRRVKGEVTGENIKAALETLKDFETGGITDKITFSDKSHKGVLGTRVFQVKNGQWVQVAGLTTASSR